MRLPIALLAAALAEPAPGEADDLPGWVKDLEPAAAPADPAPWPARVRVDTAAGVVSFDWLGDGAPPEWVPIEDVLRFERARPFEGHPDELFVVLRGERRVLVARGTPVNGHAMLLSAFSKLPVAERAPGEGHFAGSPTPGRPDPELAIGGASGGLAIRPVAGSSPLGEAAGVTVAADAAEGDAIDETGEGGGEVDRLDVDAAIKGRAGVFHRCFQRELQRNPGLAGKVVVRFVIDRDGSVKAANVRESTLSNTAVEGCLVAEILRTAFPRPRGNGTVIVSYPFLFAGE